VVLLDAGLCSSFTQGRPVHAKLQEANPAINGLQKNLSIELSTEHQPGTLVTALPVLATTERVKPEKRQCQQKSAGEHCI